MVVPLLIGLMLAGGQASTAAPNAVITNPAWIARPDGDQVSRYYPAAALERGIEGESAILCRITAEGELTDCAVIAERPAAAGFGNAEIRAAAKFRMRPQTADGIPVGGAQVVVPMQWRLTGGDAAELSAIAELTFRPPPLEFVDGDYATWLRARALEAWRANDASCDEIGLISRGPATLADPGRFASEISANGFSGAVYLERLAAYGCGRKERQSFLVGLDKRGRRISVLLPSDPDPGPERSPLYDATSLRAALDKAPTPQQLAAPPPIPRRTISEKGLLTEFTYERRLSYADLSNAYPLVALQTATQGETLTDCIVGAQGELSECVPVSEAPAGFGFSAAALKVAPKLKVKAGGESPVGPDAHVRILLKWRTSVDRLVARVAP